MIYVMRNGDVDEYNRIFLKYTCDSDMNNF